MATGARTDVVEVPEPQTITPGTCRILRVGEHEVGVFNVGGDYFAFRNSCPHMGAPVCRGRLSGTFVPTSGPGEYRWGFDGEVLHCPAHHWEWDIRTGRSMFGVNRARLIRHDVVREDGRVYVSVRPGSPAPR